MKILMIDVVNQTYTDATSSIPIAAHIAMSKSDPTLAAVTTSAPAPAATQSTSLPATSTTTAPMSLDNASTAVAAGLTDLMPMDFDSLNEIQRNEAVRTRLAKLMAHDCFRNIKLESRLDVLRSSPQSWRVLRRVRCVAASAAGSCRLPASASSSHYSL